MTDPSEASTVRRYKLPPQRLDRQLGKKFGDDAYAAEELIAELTSAFCLSELAIDHAPGADAAYIAHWVKFLTDQCGLPAR